MIRIERRWNILFLWAIPRYIVSTSFLSNDRLQRIDRQFFHLPRLYRGTSYCFGSCFEVCTRKKHVRPLKTRAWNGSKREDDEEEEERRGQERGGEEARCLKVPRGEWERERERKKGGSASCWRKRDERAPKVHTWIKRRRKREGLPPQLSLSLFLVAARRNKDERSKIETRERVRRGNRWMGLAAYPANAPSDIAVTLLCDARGVTTGCCRKIRNFGSLIDPALAAVQDSLGLPSNRGIA